MPIVPSKVQDLLMFCESHSTTWSSSPSSIGLTAAQATVFKNAYETAHEQYKQAVAANDAKLAAYQSSRASIAALRASAASTISIIKGFADAAANPAAVYSAAEIPMPAMPSPAPAPGTPTDFVATLNQTGVVTIKWKCANPAGTTGTIYECRRRIGGGSFTFIGAVGTREFSDTTLPAGSIGVLYEITAVRSTTRGNPALFNVNFGVGGGGGIFIASTSEGEPTMKMAA